MLEKNFATVICRNSKTRSGAEVIISWRNQDLFNMPSGPYGVLTARDSITDHYAVEAENKKLTPSQFAARLKKIKGSFHDAWEIFIYTTAINFI